MKSGNLNFLEPSGPLQACNGTALPFLQATDFKSCWLKWSNELYWTQMFCSSILRQASHVPRDKLTMDKSFIHTLQARRPAPNTPVPTTSRYKRSERTERNPAVKQAGNQCHWTRIQFGQLSVSYARLRAHKLQQGRFTEIIQKGKASFQFACLNPVRIMHDVTPLLFAQVVMRRITTFRSTTDRIYDGGPTIL